jgi:hypothetical protein
MKKEDKERIMKLKVRSKEHEDILGKYDNIFK